MQMHGQMPMQMHGQMPMQMHSQMPMTPQLQQLQQNVDPLMVNSFIPINENGESLQTNSIANLLGISQLNKPTQLIPNYSNDSTIMPSNIPQMPMGAQQLTNNLMQPMSNPMQQMTNPMQQMTNPMQQMTNPMQQMTNPMQQFMGQQNEETNNLKNLSKLSFVKRLV
jgi:hypothetical protein